VTEFAPSAPTLLEKPELVKDLPILQHLELFKESVIVIDESNTIVTANKAACSTFGYAVPELAGQSINLLFVDPINPDDLVQDGTTHELEAKPHHDLLPFTILLTMGRLQKGHLLVTISKKLDSLPMASLKDVGRTYSSFF